MLQTICSDKCYKLFWKKKIMACCGICYRMLLVFYICCGRIYTYIHLLKGATVAAHSKYIYPFSITHVIIAKYKNRI